MNTHWFLSLEDAYEKINGWVDEYNHFCPHSSLNDQTQAEVVEQCNSKDEIESSNSSLLAASLHEAMYLAAAEHDPTALENTCLHKEILNHHKSSKSTL